MRLRERIRLLRTNGNVRLAALLAAAIAGCVNGPLTSRPARADDQPGVPKSIGTAEQGKSGSLDPNIPTPESVIGHAIGNGAVRYEPMVRYLHALADASPLVTLTPYAMSHEGRTLYYLTITSENNHARLAQIQADNAKLADPRKLTDLQEADQLLDTLPGIAWLAYAIHGDELSSTDAALQVAYQLTAGTDDATRRLREELVIHVDPLMNPDGRERYLAQLEYLRGKVPNTDYQAMQHAGLWSAGRGNHYLFDLNRDWLMQVHPETRGRAAKILEWNPHLVVDSHEMGSLDTYLFDPPREPFNVSLSQSNLEWRRKFSADQAKAFDRHGWSYYTREWYEEWYPGYTNAWTSLQGAVGLLYEQAGVNAASIKQPAGTVLTYPESVEHHVVSSFANLDTLRANRRDILRDFLTDRQWAVSADRSGTDTFLLPPMTDKAAFDRAVELLNRHGLEYGIAAEPVQATSVTNVWGDESETRQFPAGTLIVPAAQPRRRLLEAILQFDPHMSDSFLKKEREDLENHRGTRIYDITAWNLPMAYGLPAFWAKSVAPVSFQPPPTNGSAAPSASPGYGYLIDGATGHVYRALAQLLEDDVKVRVATKPFRIAGHDYQPGTLLLRNHENPKEPLDQLKKLAEEEGLIIRGVDTGLCEDGPDLGGPRFDLLVPPRIAIASQWPIATSSFGSTWYLLDARIGLRTSPINLQFFTRLDLRKYNVIVLPHSWSPTALAGVLDEAARKKLKTWIEAGGTLIALGRSAAFVADKDHDLSSVRLRRDVLDQLDVYAEALKREKSARHVNVDPNAVWGKLPIDATDEDDHPESKPDEKSEAPPAGPKPSSAVESLKRQDAWQRLFYPRGVMLSAQFDPDHWLTFGLVARNLDAHVPVLYFGDHVLMSKYPVRTPVRLVDPDRLRLSGLMWPEARERWANAAYATVERIGRGQIILFAADPFFRAYTEATGRLLLNALLLGPGLGTSQPVPW